MTNKLAYYIIIKCKIIRRKVMLPYGCKGCPVVVMPYSPSALVRVSVAWRAVPRQLSHTGMMKPRPIWM
ncbi:unknown [Prevotella sp. CAG:924]|nr:unknown [Prevotella sp. CAG:924]